MKCIKFKLRALIAVLFCIFTGEMLKGNLPIKAIKLVKEWVLEHKIELENDWHLAQNLDPLEKIPGADND